MVDQIFVLNSLHPNITINSMADLEMLLNVASLYLHRIFTFALNLRHNYRLQLINNPMSKITNTNDE